MRNIRPKRGLLPPWKHALRSSESLMVVSSLVVESACAFFFWLPIIGMIIYETYLSAKVSGITSGVVAGIITLLVGLVVWGGLYGVLFALNLSTTISQTIADVGRMQRTFSTRRPPPLYSFSSPILSRKSRMWSKAPSPIWRKSAKKRRKE